MQYGLKSIVVLPTNLYGPRDNFNTSISHVILVLIVKLHDVKLFQSKSIEVWGDRRPTRDILYVEDAASGIVRAAQTYEADAPINLGSEQVIPIKELVHKIVSLMEYNGELGHLKA